MTISKPRTVLTGRGLVESPRWHEDRLYFSDWSAGEVIRTDLDGNDEVVASVKSLPLCTAWLPDGICVDVENAVWYAEVPGKRCVRVTEGGAQLRTVDLDRGGFACVLGGRDRSTLLITAAEWRGMTDSEMVAPASGEILAIDIEVPGAGWP